MSPRPPGEDRTIFYALCVLDDAVKRLQYKGLLKPEHGVRLALAYLFSVSREPRDREPYDELWRTLLGRDDLTVKQASFRSTWAGTQFAGICRSVGVAQSIEMMQALAAARAGEKDDAATAHARFAAAVKQAGEQIRAQRFAKIDANTCALDRPGLKR